MRKTHITLFIMALLLLVVSILPAQKLARDVNGYRIQMPRTFTAVRDSIPTQSPATYDSLQVDTSACEVDLWFAHQAGYIYTGPAKKSPTTAEWIYVPKGVVIQLPYLNADNRYIKYKSATGANSINVIIKKL